MQLSFKTWVARALERGGVLAVAERLLGSRRRVVFALHRVLPEEEMGECYNPYLAITPGSFDHFLQWLRGRASVVALDELLATDSPTAGAVCALTFDDGWEDNYRVAFPILQAHSLPALIYLATGFIGTREMLPEEHLWRILRKASHAELIRLGMALPKSDGPATLGGAFKQLPYANKIALLKDFPLSGDSLRKTAAFMDWSQVEEMHKAGVSFGSHTVHHAILPRESAAMIEKELQTSQQELDKRLRQNTVHFAYPSGAFDARTVAAVEAAGYRTAVTTATGSFDDDCSFFSIPRLPLDNTVVNDAKGRFAAERAHFLMARQVLGRATIVY